MDAVEMNRMGRELAELWEQVKIKFQKDIRSLRDEISSQNLEINCLQGRVEFITRNAETLTHNEGYFRVLDERNGLRDELDKARVKIADLETRPPWEAGRDPHRVRLILENCDLRGVVKRLRQGLSEAQVEAQIPTRGDEYQRLLQAEHQLSRIAANSKIVLLREED